MLEILYTLIPIFTIMFLGVFVERKRILPSNAGVCLNSFVYCVSLPLLIFSSMATIKVEDIPQNSAIAYFVALIFSQVIAHIAFKFMGENNKNACMGSLVSAFPNSAYMGLPIIALLFPNSPVAIMNVTITIILPTAILVYTDTFLTMSQNSPLSFWGTLQNIFRTIFKNPLLLCFFLGLFVSFSGLYFPESILHATKMLGSTAAPCALFCMGISLTVQITQRLAYIKEKKVRENQSNIITKNTPTESILIENHDKFTWHLGRQVYMTFHKLILMPCLTFVLCYCFGVRGISLVVLTLISAMPSAIAVTVLSEKHEVMIGDSAMGVVINTVISLFTLFLTMSLLQNL